MLAQATYSELHGHRPVIFQGNSTARTSLGTATMELLIRGNDIAVHPGARNNVTQGTAGRQGHARRTLNGASEHSYSPCWLSMFVCARRRLSRSCDSRGMP